MGFKKNLGKLLNEPTEMHINDVCNILVRCGYKLRSIEGSHYHFTHKTWLKITIPSHNKKVTKYYLKNIKKIIMPLLQTII